MIVFDNVSKQYNGSGVALYDVNFEIKEGEFVSVVGQSGAGKSTLLKMIFAEEKPTNGRILIKGRDITEIKQNKLPILRRHIGVVFQDFKLLDKKTVFENVSFAMEVAGKSDKEIEDDVPQVLDIVGLLDKKGRYPSELSGGEKQRVSIARALVHRPDIIVADEPTGNLDLVNTWDIVQLLVKINQYGTTIILATHNIEIVNLVNKRVLTIDDGRVVKDQLENGKYIL
ncbi:MAG: cell division ATP-binding protein FtsE [Candidatus Pacebacteria bacterium]|nr:cell division ATP-binding protein FtsE [Candidatus Paceibacterota bacterium]